MVLKTQSLICRLFVLVIFLGFICSISAAQVGNVSNITYTPALMPVDAKEITMKFCVHSCYDNGPVIEGANVTVSDAGSEVHYGTTDRNGLVEITGLSGLWYIFTTVPGFDYTSEVHIKTEEWSSTSQYDISYPKNVTLTLLYKDQFGSPINGVRVTVKDHCYGCVEGYSVGGSDEYYTDSDGRIVVEDTCSAADNIWDLSAEAFGYESMGRSLTHVIQDTRIEIEMHKVREVDSKPNSQQKDSNDSVSDSENDIVGKWLLTNEDGGMWYMEFYKDGTFLGTNRWIGLEQLQDSITAGHNSLSTGEGGEWMPDDDEANVVRCKRDNGKGYEWTIEGDTMNGFEISSNGHKNPVSAKRVYDGGFFPDE